MASFSEMLQQYTEPPATPAEELPLREGWDLLTDKWPDFNPPELPKHLSVKWITNWLLCEEPPP